MPAAVVAVAGMSQCCCLRWVSQQIVKQQNDNLRGRQTDKQPHPLRPRLITAACTQRMAYSWTIVSSSAGPLLPITGYSPTKGVPRNTHPPPTEHHTSFTAAAAAAHDISHTGKRPDDAGSLPIAHVQGSPSPCAAAHASSYRIGLLWAGPGAAPSCSPPPPACSALAPLPRVLELLRALRNSCCRTRALLVVQHALRRLPIQQASHHAARIPADETAAVPAELPPLQAPWAAGR
jgi:hypothetical protein